MSAHTPGPWRSVCDRPNTRKGERMAMVSTRAGRQCIDCTGSGKSFAEDVANAEFIVRAVNSHDALLASAKEMLAGMVEFGDWAVRGGAHTKYPEQFAGFELSMRKAKAAIAKAEGREATHV